MHTYFFSLNSSVLEAKMIEVIRSFIRLSSLLLTPVQVLRLLVLKVHLM